MLSLALRAQSEQKRLKGKPSPRERAVYFSPCELEAMDEWCFAYKALVRGGGKPTGEQDSIFLAYSAVCYDRGVALR